MAERKSGQEATIEVLDGPARKRGRRRFSAEEKRSFVEEASKPGSSISLVARQYRISPSQLFRWKRLMEEGTLSSLGSDENVVPESALEHAEARIRELERLLGKKTLENKIPKEAVEIGRAKRWISRSLWPGDK